MCKITYDLYILSFIRNRFRLYTDKFGINVLQFNYIFFAKNHPGIDEVEKLIFELNYTDQEKYILEGQRRYREQMNSQYTAGYTDAEEKCKAEIAEKERLIAKIDAEIAEKERLIAEKEAEIARTQKG